MLIKAMNTCLSDIRTMLRRGEIDYSFLFNKMCNIDDYVTDNGPIVDKYLTQYNKDFDVNPLDLQKD